MKKENTVPEGFTPVDQETTTVAVLKNDIAPAELLDNLKNPTSSFMCSIVDDGTRSSKIKIYNALNTEGEQLTDHMGEVLEITDIAAHTVRLADMNTGEITDTVRTVLITKDGTCYQAVSQGVISSLQKIMAIVGMPSWKDDPLKIKVRQITTSNKFKVTTLELVE